MVSAEVKEPTSEVVSNERPPVAGETYPIRLQLPPAWSLTDDLLLTLGSLNEEWCFEADANGGLLIMAPPGPLSGSRELRIASQVLLWSDRQGAGRTFPSAMFRLPNGWRRAPDVAWISDERLAGIAPYDEGVWQVCPDLVVEVQSRTDRSAEVRTKMEMWIGQGAREAWLVDPYEEALWIYRPDHDPLRLQRPSSAAAAEIADDLEIDLTEVWPAVKSSD